MRRFAAVLLGAGLLVMGLAGSASAQTQSNQRFIVVGGGSGSQVNFTVIAIGAITAVGTFEETDDEDVVRFRFPQGTITLDAPDDDETEQFDERTCVGSFTFRGPFTISGATGAFQGATGGGRFEGKGTFIAERGPAGCSEDEDSGFFFLYVTVTGNVTVSSRAAA